MPTGTVLASYGPVQTPDLPEVISVKFNTSNITVVNGTALLNVGTAKRWLMFCYCGVSRYKFIHLITSYAMLFYRSIALMECNYSFYCWDQFIDAGDNKNIISPTVCWGMYCDD